MLKIFIIAGEASGDIIGAKLIKELSVNPDIDCTNGIGGERMMSHGLKSLFPMEEISIMGFFEILPHIFKIRKLINLTVAKIYELQPDAVVTIDSAGFCMRVVQKLKNMDNMKNTKFIHYVAPTVWAYKKHRAKVTAKLYNHLLTILPFEAPFFTKEGLDTTFVGHPLTESHLGNGLTFRKKYNIPESSTIICISPGSRITEVKRLLPIFIKAINLFLQKVPSIYLAIPTSHNLEHIILENIKNLNTNNYIICTNFKDKKDLMNAANLALTKCGTITNEFAFNNVPMVAAYMVNTISALIIRKMLKIPYVSLINILANDEVIKECLQKDCNPAKLFKELYLLYTDKNLREQQLIRNRKIIKKLYNNKQKTPSNLAADVVLKIVNKELIND